MPIGLGTAAAIGAGGAIIGGGISALGATSAAKTQANAATNAANMQMSMYNTTRGDLAPYRAEGQAALPAVYQLLGLQPPAGTTPGSTNNATGAAGSGFSSQDFAAIRAANPGIATEYTRASAAADKNSPAYKAQGLDSLDNYTNYWYNNMRNPADYTYAAPTSSGAGTGGAATGGPLGADATGMQAFLAQTPGYQFALQQGTQGVNNTLAARGLGGLSGSLGKGLAKYITGLADSTYQQQLGNYMNLANNGQNAANQTGVQGTSLAGNAGTQVANAGTAAAGGTVGATSALGGAISGVSNAALTNAYLNRTPSTGVYGVTTTPAPAGSAYNFGLSGSYGL